jgi:SAM-dependent methyltransferase
MGFDELVTEAAAVSVDGWDFSWLTGRATEERTGWEYVRSMGERMAKAQAALDLETGGGEQLASVSRLAPLTVATESWPPNHAKATALLRPRGVAVLDIESLKPFADATFDLVVGRHPVHTPWAEIARVLMPGGTFFSQQVGSGSVRELTEYFLGPQPESNDRDAKDAAKAAEAAGLTVVDLREKRLRMEFFDVGAVVYFLRKVVWTVPGFTVESYRRQLKQLPLPFVAHSTRFLIEARKDTP